MVEDKQDALARAFATLSSLRKNIGEMTAYRVLETYVNEYHTVLDRMKDIGIDVSEFRIPDSEVKPDDSWSYPHSRSRAGGGGDQVTYSKEKYVGKSFILMKLDAILGYFGIITSEKPRRIGFTKPEK